MITDSLKARAARTIAESAEEKPKRRLVSGTEPVKPIQEPMRPIANTANNEQVARSTISMLKDSFKGD